jgi:hypothetical protein
VKLNGERFSLPLRPWEIRRLCLRIVRDNLSATAVNALEQPVAGAGLNKNRHAMTTADLIHAILHNDLFDSVLVRGKGLFSHSLTAGDRYPEVWIRDFSTFLKTACQLGKEDAVKDALRVFFNFQKADGEVVDGYAPASRYSDAYNFVETPAHPDLRAHKNSVETDQESSLVLGIAEYVTATGDTAFLSEVIEGTSVLDRLEMAMNWVLKNRWSAAHGLVWNATTLDWGDGQASTEWVEVSEGVPLTPELLPMLTELGPHSHPALCIYTNALFSLALEAMARLTRMVSATGKADVWQERLEQLKAAIRQHLWDASRQKFHPHVYLEKGSPFPAGFDEEVIYYHGGTGVAMQAGLLDQGEARHAFETMNANVRAAGARTVGLTVWPLYNVPALRNTLFERPFFYQNGGDWPWFGSRIPLGLLRCGCPEEAYLALLPIARMIEDADGFYEWYRPDGTPTGSSGFRGAAGVTCQAITALRDWAQKQ